MNHLINKDFERPDPALIERFRTLSLPLAALYLGRSQMMDPAIRSLWGRDWTICGPAVTVKLEYIDIMMGYVAAKVAKPGDVIVVAAQGHMAEAVWGGSMTRSARNAGCEGVVVDGVIEASKALLGIGVPIFSRGSSIATGSFEKPGSINVPISCGGCVVNPGDLILGNQDGIIVVPRAEMETIIEPAEASSRNVPAVRQRFETDRTLQAFDDSKVAEKLSKLGVAW